jgi:hypothetical protein
MNKDQEIEIQLGIAQWDWVCRILKSLVGVALVGARGAFGRCSAEPSEWMLLLLLLMVVMTLGFRRARLETTCWWSRSLDCPVVAGRPGRCPYDAGLGT